MKKVYGHDLVVKELIASIRKKLWEVCNALPGSNQNDFLNDESYETEVSSFRDWTTQRTNMTSKTMGFKGTLRANSWKQPVATELEDDDDTTPSTSFTQSNSIYSIQKILCSS